MWYALTSGMYAIWGMWILRAAVGIVFIVHGWPKVKNPKGIAGAYGAPVFVGTLHGLVELLGGLALILGMYTKIVALFFSLIMMGAIYFKAVKWRTPFKADNATGWEFDLVLLAANLYILTS